MSLMYFEMLLIGRKEDIPCFDRACHVLLLLQLVSEAYPHAKLVDDVDDVVTGAHQVYVVIPPQWSQPLFSCQDILVMDILETSLKGSFGDPGHVHPVVNDQHVHVVAVPGVADHVVAVCLCHDVQGASLIMSSAQHVHLTSRC